MPVTIGKMDQMEELEKKLLLEKALNKVLFLTQFLTWPLLFPVFLLLFDIRINGRENFSKIKSPFILVANHFAFFDSFLLRIILGLFTTHLPLRFMAVKKFRWRFLNILYYTGIVNCVYFLFGAFTINPGDGIENNLRRSEFILKSGGNVVIYPEGKINTEQGLGEFKKGAVVLAQKSGVPILPLTFLVQKGFMRKKLIVNIGTPIIISLNSSPVDATCELREKMISIYSKGS